MTQQLEKLLLKFTRNNILFIKKHNQQGSLRMKRDDELMMVSTECCLLLEKKGKGAIGGVSFTVFQVFLSLQG